MRLRTLPVSVAGVVMAWGLAVGAPTCRWTPGVLCLVFAILCQVASNFANEYFDYRAGRDRAGRQGPRRGVTEGDITPAAMKRAVFITLLLAAAVGMWLPLWGGWWMVAAGVCIFVGAMAYSTGPWPLSTHCLGEVAVVLFFGLVPVSLTVFLMTGACDWQTIAAAVAIGLMGANVLIVNNYRDIPDDRAVGKHTLATELPSVAMPLLYMLNALVAVVLTLDCWRDLGQSYAVVPAVYLIFALVIVLRMRKLRGSALTPLLGITSVLMFVYALVYLLARTL